MDMNVKPSESIAILAAINPSNQAAGVQTTSWLPFNVAQSILAIISIGAMGTGATVTAALQQAQDASGTNAKAITNNKVLTSITQAGSTGNVQAEINLAQAELDLANGFGYVQLSITVAVAAVQTSAVLLGIPCTYQPAYLSNVATVAQNVL